MRWIGGALAAGGVLFVVEKFHQYGADIEFHRFDARIWQTLFILILVYGAANLLLALAWRNLLGFLGDLRPRRWAVRIYGMSQIAKYLPGNVFHLAGRQALGVAHGGAGWPLAKSTILELGLIALAGVLFGLLVLPMIQPNVPVIAATVLFAFITGGCWLILHRLISPMVAYAFGWHTFFLGLSGMIFLAILAEVGGIIPGPGLAIPVVGAYVLAWLAGFVTPGAPAGVGVRELVLFALLGSMIEPPALLLAVALGRVISVSGDVMFFLGCAAAPALRSSKDP